MNQKSTRLGSHIPLIYHFAMLQDRQRMEGFREAISYAVKPGARVLELGGGTGVLSFFAAQNAAKVYCIEQIPENARAARSFLDVNSHGDRVEVICADAFEYLPPEPVDVVICEMLHVGMVREQQIAVIESFKKRYQAKFGEQLPRFIPEAFFQGIQPISYDFNFFGYQAPISLFQAPGESSQTCVEMADPLIFQVAQYRHDLLLALDWEDSLKMKTSGTLNAVRLILKNVLAIVPEENRGIYWHNQYLILPLKNPLEVASGEQVKLSLSYAMGCEIEDLIDSILVKRATPHPSLSSQIERDNVSFYKNDPAPEPFDVVKPDGAFAESGKKRMRH